MRPDFKPMLAAAIARPSDTAEQIDEKLSELSLPVLVTPKFDGIRVTTVDIPNGEYPSLPVCRSLKQVPNHHIRKKLSGLPPGLDGEVVTYSEDLFDKEPKMRNFPDIQSDVMSETGFPLFKFHVFDQGFLVDPHMPYRIRVTMLREYAKQFPNIIVPVEPALCETLEQLKACLDAALLEGHEGVCFRTPDSPYKYGRSTLKQGWLVKWKVFTDSEAEIIGYEEEMRNDNEATINELGYQERSSHKANLVGKNRLGALVCRTPAGVEFKIGSGFTADQRQNMWFAKETLIGKIANYKHQPFGAKDKPRIPIFRAIRSKIDMS